MATVAEIFVTTLKKLNVTVIFGVPSGNFIDYLDAIKKNSSIEFILVTHEAAASFMADVYWRCKGTVAACFGTFGPGACNVSTGVCTAYLDRSPLLVFADEMDDPWLSRSTQMNIDQQTLFKPITKWQTRIHKDSVASTLYKAYSYAIEPIPGPVYIGLPRGLGTELCTEESLEIQLLSTIFPHPTQETLVQLSKQITHAQKPLIVLGIGAMRLTCIQNLIQWAETLTIPVILTPMAKGVLSEDSPVYCGVLGHGHSDTVAHIHTQADVVIAIGYDTVELPFEHWINAHAILVHIHAKAADIEKTTVSGLLNVVIDIPSGIEYLIPIKPKKIQWQQSQLLVHKEKLFSKFTRSSSVLNPCTILTKLRDMLPKDAIVCADVGAHLHLLGQAWKAYHSLGCIMTNGGSSMGFALPAACAAALCKPHSPVVCICGDGGFLMMMGELATILRLKVKVIVLVVCDYSLSLIRIKQQKKSYEAYGTELSILFDANTSFFQGIQTHYIQTIQQYTDALNTAQRSKISSVLLIAIDTKEYDGLILR